MRVRVRVTISLRVRVRVRVTTRMRIRVGWVDVSVTNFAPRSVKLRVRVGPRMGGRGDHCHYRHQPSL